MKAEDIEKETENCSSATLSATNSILTALGSNLGIHKMPHNCIFILIFLETTLK